jgi:acetyl-CoA carboxylase carboxyltransferase component
VPELVLVGKIDEIRANFAYEVIDCLAKLPGLAVDILALERDLAVAYRLEEKDVIEEEGQD